MNDATDLLGVLATVIYLAGMGAVTVRALLLRRRQHPPEGRSLTAFTLACAAVGYLLFIFADAPSVVSVLTNSADDIPLSSTARALLFGAWMWLLHALLWRLARGRLQ